MTTLLIDMDVIQYRAAFAAQHTDYQLFLQGEEWPLATFRYKKELKEWVELKGLEEEDYDVVKLPVVEPVENALYSAKHMLESMLDKFNTTSYRGFLTGKDNFREELVDYYKANRTQDKPVHYQAVRDYLIKFWNAEVVDGQEADDALGIAQWRNTMPEREFADNFKCLQGLNDNTVICTNDKDLDMIPGEHYNFTKEGSDSYWVDEDMAMYCFYKQLLTGDPTDNIKGVPGVGKVKAGKILHMSVIENDFYLNVLEVYQEHYPDNAEEVLLENARLLWIRREEGQLWNPPATGLIGQD